MEYVFPKSDVLSVDRTECLTLYGFKTGDCDLEKTHVIEVPARTELMRAGVFVWTNLHCVDYDILKEALSVLCEN